MDNKDKVNALIEAFNPLIFELEDLSNNVVIGGTTALFLHGVELHREIDDLDIIIYSPTEKQKKILKVLSSLDETVYYGLNKKTLKLRGAKDSILNILTEADRVPDNLLTFNNYRVQSVRNVVKAKANYSIKSSSDVVYTRRKDVIDLQELKKLNFNYS